MVIFLEIKGHLNIKEKNHFLLLSTLINVEDISCRLKWKITHQNDLNDTPAKTFAVKQANLNLQ